MVFARFKFLDSWPIADEVFTHIPFIHEGSYPMYYVAFMTFVLIMSSVTMVLAVDAGHNGKKNAITWYLFATVIGGIIFVGSQAWEWATFIKGEYGAIETKMGNILQLVDAKDHTKRIAISDIAIEDPTEQRVQHTGDKGIWFKSDEKTLSTYSVAEVVAGIKADPNVLLRTQDINEEGEKVVLDRQTTLARLDYTVEIVEGANMVHNEYGTNGSLKFLFFITGFHGFHSLFSGVIINIIIWFNVILPDLREKRRTTKW